MQSGNISQIPEGKIRKSPVLHVYRWCSLTYRGNCSHHFVSLSHNHRRTLLEVWPTAGQFVDTVFLPDRLWPVTKSTHHPLTGEKTNWDLEGLEGACGGRGTPASRLHVDTFRVFGGSVVSVLRRRRRLASTSRSFEWFVFALSILLKCKPLNVYNIFSSTVEVLCTFQATKA